MKRLKTWLELDGAKLGLWEILWLLMPVAIWFSYQPLIRLGQNDTMHFELSIALVGVAILGLAGLPIVWKKRRDLIKNRAVWLFGTFVIWSCLSLFWTTNLTRGILTCGVLGLVFAVFLAVQAEKARFKKILPTLVKILIISAVAMSFLALIQVVAGVWLGRDATLLCAGCTAEQFGFVRPNVFAIEPQFFGSLLLAPLLILLHLILAKKSDWRLNLIFVFLMTTLFLTLSRGAIFAFAVGAIVLLVVNYKRWCTVLAGCGLTVVGFVVALFIQGATVAINPNISETFSGAVAKSVHHLSLGKIDFRVKSVVKNTTQTKPTFDGYVEESTDTRVNLSKLALETWVQNPKNVAIGVGLGGAGAAMHQSFPEKIGAREIVQNEFAEILLERGLVGAMLFVGLVVGLILRTKKTCWLWAIVAAFLFQWLFFSGMPNALHVFLILIAIFIWHPDRSKPAKRS